MKDALESLRKALSHAKEFYGSEARNRTVAKLYFEIGEVLLSGKQADKAIEMMNKCLRIQRELNCDKVAICNTIFQIGEIHRSIDEYMEATGCYNDILMTLGVQEDELESSIKTLQSGSKKLRQQLSFDQDVEELKCKAYQSIGSLELKQKNFEEALKAFEKHLAIKEMMLGESHPDIAKTFNSIGQVMVMQEKFEEGLKCFKKALKIYTKRYGSGHIDTAKTHYKMGKTYQKMDNSKSALSEFKKALSIMLDNYDECFKECADLYNEIGKI